MKTIYCVDRLAAIAKYPKAQVIRRIAPGVYECFADHDEYYLHLLATGKKVNQKWLKKMVKHEEIRSAHSPESSVPGDLPRSL